MRLLLNARVVLAAAAAVAAMVDCGLPGGVGSGGAGGGASTSGPSSGSGMHASVSAGTGGASSGGGGGAGATGGGTSTSNTTAATGTGGAMPSDIIIEAEDATLSSPGASAHSWTSQTDVPGYSGASFMQCGPGTGAACTDTTMLDVCAASMTYGVTIATAATYWFQVRMYAVDNSQNSIWYGIDGALETPEIDVNPDSMWHWVTGNSVSLAAGAHTITIWQRECGARVDVLALTSSSQPPMVP